METRFYLKVKKDAKEGTVLFYYTTDNGKPLRISTGKKCAVDLWDKGFPKMVANTRELRERLSAYKQLVDEQIYEAEKRGIFPTEKMLREWIDQLVKGNTSINDKSMNDLANDYIKAFTTKRNHKTVHNKRRHINEFLNGETVQVRDVDEDFIEAYTTRINSESHLQLSTINSKFKNVKAFLNYCASKKKLSYDLAKCIVKEKEESKPVISVKASELLILKQAILKPRLQKAVDLFLMMADSGLAYTDLSRIKKEMIEEDKGVYRMDISRIKTGEVAKITLTKSFLNLFEKYNGAPKLSNVHANDYLKEAFKILGLDRPIKMIDQRANKSEVYYKPLYEVITSHSGRKTLITSLTMQKVPERVIMRIAGIKKSVTLERYTDIDDEAIDDVMLNLEENRNIGMMKAV